MTLDEARTPCIKALRFRQEGLLLARAIGEHARASLIRERIQIKVERTPVYTWAFAQACEERKQALITEVEAASEVRRLTALIEARALEKAR